MHARSSTRAIRFTTASLSNRHPLIQQQQQREPRLRLRHIIRMSHSQLSEEGDENLSSLAQTIVKTNQLQETSQKIQLSLAIAGGGSN